MQVESATSPMLSIENTDCVHKIDEDKLLSGNCEDCRDHARRVEDEINLQSEGIKNREVHVTATFGKWLVFIAGVLNYSLSVGLSTALSVMFPEWQDTFQVSRSRTAAVYSTCVGTMFAGGTVAGFVVKRLGPRFTVVLGACLASCGFLLSVFATSIEFLVITTGLMAGFGMCFIFIPCIPCISQEMTNYKSIFLALPPIVAGLTCLVLPYVYNMLIYKYSWRGTFFILSGISLNCLVVGLVMTSYVPSTATLSSELLSISAEEPANAQKERSLRIFNDGSHFSNAATHEGADTTKDHRTEHTSNGCFNLNTSEFSFWLNPLFISLFISCCITFPGTYSFGLMLMDFAKWKGFHETAVGISFIAIYTAGSIFGRALAGFCNLSSKFHSIYIFCISGCVASLAVITLVGVWKYELIAVLLAVLGLGVGGIISVYPKCLLDIVNGPSFPLAYGFIISGYGVMCCLSPILIGNIVDMTSSYFLPLVIFGIVALIGSLIPGVVLWHVHRKRSSYTQRGPSGVTTIA